MSIIEPPPDRHCRLPRPENHPDGTLAQCRDCGRWHVKFTDYTYWREEAWRRVHWWEFRLRKHIKQNG